MFGSILSNIARHLDQQNLGDGYIISGIFSSLFFNYVNMYKRYVRNFNDRNVREIELIFFVIKSYLR